MNTPRELWAIEIQPNGPGSNTWLKSEVSAANSKHAAPVTLMTRLEALHVANVMQLTRGFPCRAVRFLETPADES